VSEPLLLVSNSLIVNVMLYSCSNDEDLSAYMEWLEIQNTGGEDGNLPLPPPPPPVIKP